MVSVVPWPSLPYTSRIVPSGAEDHSISRKFLCQKASQVRGGTQEQGEEDNEVDLQLDIATFDVHVDEEEEVNRGAPLLLSSDALKWPTVGPFSAPASK